MNPKQIELSRHFRPLDAAAYLRVHGWRQTQVVPERYSLWVMSDQEYGEFEVMLPEQLHARDLPVRVAELVEALAVQERRSADEIVEDLATPNSDVVRARLMTVDDSPTLPLEEGSEVFQSIRNLFLAAGCAAWKPRARYGSKKPDDALEFVRGTRLGLTRPGSYIIKVVTPVSPPRFEKTVPSERDEPFTRRATVLLSRALQTVLKSIRGMAADGPDDAVNNLVSAGVSANLCDALAGLGRAGRTVEFSFSWAAARPPLRNPGERFTMPEGSVPYIEGISELLRHTTTLEDAEFFGTVRKLEKLNDDADRITMTGILNDERRTVIAEVDGETRRRATGAFHNRSPVSCVGEAVKEGRTYKLENLREFELLPDPD